MSINVTASTVTPPPVLYIGEPHTVTASFTGTSDPHDGELRIRCGEIELTPLGTQPIDQGGNFASGEFNLPTLDATRSSFMPVYIVVVDMDTQSEQVAGPYILRTRN